MRGMLRSLMTVLLGVALTAPLSAQDPGPEPARAAELRRQIEERFTARVKEDLALTDGQAEKLRGVARDYFGRRRDLEAEERRLRAALASELRPGVAGNRDNIARLTEQFLDLKVRYAQSYKDEARELGGFLDPVQRAQYFILRERLLERVREIQEQRQDNRPLQRRRQPPR